VLCDSRLQSHGSAEFGQEYWWTVTTSKDCAVIENCVSKITVILSPFSAIRTRCSAHMLMDWHLTQECYNNPFGTAPICSPCGWCSNGAYAERQIRSVRHLDLRFGQEAACHASTLNKHAYTNTYIEGCQENDRIMHSRNNVPLFSCGGM
jgi:hypothetical protein